MMKPEVERGTNVKTATVRHGGFYEERAAEYFEGTRNVDMAELYSRFLSEIPPGGLILDAGSGSGRDTLAFVKFGYGVEAFDASAALAAISSDATGVKTEVLAFEDFAARPDRYDGIWALASLLHVPREHLARVVAALAASLKPGGVFLATFKAGRSDLVDDFGRSFTNMTQDTAKRLFWTTGLFDKVEVREVEGAASFGRRAIWVCPAQLHGADPAVCHMGGVQRLAGRAVPQAPARQAARRERDNRGTAPARSCRDARFAGLAL
jgi:SAM-dependent methyltransferase